MDSSTGLDLLLRVEQKLDRVGERVYGLEQTLRSDMATLRDSMRNDITKVSDTSEEKIDQLDRRIDQIELKTERHDIAIRAMFFVAGLIVASLITIVIPNWVKPQGKSVQASTITK